MGTIILFSIILLILLVWLGMNRKEGFNSYIDTTIDYTNVVQYITDISNNFVKDCDYIKFTINDPSGNLNPSSPNYSGVQSIGKYYYNYLQAHQPKDYSGIIPKISFDYDSSFAVLYNETKFNPTDISGVDVDKSAPSFVSIIKLCKELDTIIKMNKDTSTFTLDQIHEYNMLIFTYVLFTDIANSFAIISGVLDSLPTVYGKDLLQKYGTMSDNIINGLNQKIPAFLYYVIPYYMNNTYNIPKADVVTGVDLNPDTIFTIDSVKYNLLPYCYSEGTQSVMNDVRVQALFKKFNY